MQNPFLVGADVYLRPLEREDARALVAWLNDPEVTRYLLQYRPITLHAEEEYLRRTAESTTDLTLGIVVRQSEQFIGVTALHQIDFRNRHASFGITIGDREAWGRGHGTEATRLVVGHAFRTLNLNRVWLHVTEFNERALRAYEKVGFRVEGRLRQDTFRDGRYWDTMVMGLLRDEWQAG